jgi:hypothetical protein
MSMAEYLIKPSTIGYYQMVKGCAETGSLIPNIKTEYDCYMFPNQSCMSALSKNGSYM